MADNTKPRILLVEDEIVLSKITCKQLSIRGYDVVPALDMASTIELVKSEQFDLILMDIMLPDGDGNEAVRIIRGDEIGYKGPIIFLSCVGDGSSIVDSFRTGGNDYLIKPVEPEVLVSRIEENLKMWSSQTAKSKVRYFKTFSIDRSRHEIRHVSDGKQGEIIDLSPKEYKLLETFIDNAEEILLYEELYSKVWGEDFLDDTKTVMVHVSNLRKKIDQENLGFIKSIRGTGYLFTNA